MQQEYDPQKIETEIQRVWQDRGEYTAKEESEKETF